MQHLFVIPLAAALPQEPQAPVGGPTDRSAAGSTGTGNPQAPAGGGQPQGSCASPEMMLFMPLMLLIMWLMVIRPEQKRKKEAQALLAALKQGEQVVTIGGMHGRIHSLTQTEVVLEVDSVRMTFDRSAIARVVGREPQKPEGKKA